MSFFERWFGPKEQVVQQPDVRFGRYSDAHKPTQCYDAWDAAVAAHAAGRYMDSYVQFLQFLRDDDEDNVLWERHENRLSFELFQGSKRIVGWATAHRLRVEARVARITEPRPELLRRLVEHNYALKFSRYAIDPDSHIVVVFDTDSAEASPYKLYYAFKELATQADKQDDLLLEEFKHTQAVDSTHLTPLPVEETAVKHRFIIQQIEATLHSVSHGSLDATEYPGGIACLLLALVYKLDYLVKPEGLTMETLERIHREFFANDVPATPQQRNTRMVVELQTLLQRTQADYSREMYRVKTTFGITAAVTHERIANLIATELPQMEWYLLNGHEHIAAAYPTYIVGYSLFNYAVPQPDRDFFHLYFRVVEPAYFRDLQFSQSYYHPKTGQLNGKAISQAVGQIARKHLPRYPNLRPVVSQLVFDNLTAFARSYLLMVKDLDMTRLD